VTLGLWANRIILAVRGCIQKFPDWPPGARTANGTVLCHYVQLYRYFMSQSSEFCRHDPLCCFSTSVYCCCYCCCWFHYRLSPETFGYNLVCVDPCIREGTVCKNLYIWTHDLTSFNVTVNWKSPMIIDCRNVNLVHNHLNIQRCVQNGSEADPASCTMGTSGSFSEG
jgi:hypothetical protein